MDYNFNDMVERIKTIKREKGLTNAELSNLSDVPYGTLNKILGSETKEPSINSIIKIANALGTTTDYIVYGKKEKKYSPSRWEAIRPELDKLSDDEFLELFKYVEFLLWKKEFELRNKQKPQTP